MDIMNARCFDIRVDAMCLPPRRVDMTMKGFEATKSVPFNVGGQGTTYHG